MKAFGGMEV